MRRLGFLLAALALVPLACERAAPAEDCVDLTGTAPARVEMAGMAFVPACFSVSGSQAIALVNEDAVDHTFTIRGTSVDLDVEGDRAAQVGPLAGAISPGTYDLLCRYHPEMTGSITVS
ncbi:MAG: hypothetical protein KatS3mg014_2228 [Actinomycetota bacterium]|nr:MAG: hypothetical protein KatS3mg014_2228 [Actinomycetota bacterium]